MKRNSRDLKHAAPDIRALIKGKLTEAKIGLLKELTTEKRMNDEIKEYWEGFDAAKAEEEERRVAHFTERREII